MQHLYHQQDDKDPLLMTTTALRLKAVFPGAHVLRVHLCLLLKLFLIVTLLFIIHDVPESRKRFTVY